MGTISLENVRKVFGDAVIIPGADLEIRDGEFIVFVGPSGCGKSTLLRLIAGLEDLTSGTIKMDSKDITDLAPAERGLAMVFQSYALYPHMSVRNNIAFPLMMAKAPQSEIDAKVKQAAEKLNLTEYLDRKPRQLSGGQRQRVAIGRAIVRNPKAFLFDEPLSNLDAALRVNMRVEIMQMHQDMKATMVYVTHDQVEAMTMADRIVVLNKGVIEQVGSPLDLYNKPDSLFVAGFIGSPKMNFVTGGLAAKYKAKTIGVRPEHIDIVAGKGEWPGTILLTEHLGSDSFLHVDAGDAGRLIVRAPGEFAGNPGDAISLKPDARVSSPYDYIIVGGGSAGCVAAWRLVKDKGARVLMIERGPAKASGLSAFYLPMPAGWMKGIRGSEVVEMHQPVPQKHLDGRAPAVGQANVLGGGTSVNAMVYTRGQHEDYDHWDHFLGGGSGWSFADLLPHFRDMEHNHGFHNPWHGVDGPLHVSNVGNVCELTENYILAVQGLGIPFNPDFNGAQQRGVGTMQYTTHRNRRCNGVESFLAALGGDKRLTIKTGCTVSRLIIENHKCVGVAFVNNGVESIARCEAEVLLAAGCYNTPKILLLSGIGPAAELSSHGVKVLVDAAGVGENLQDHHEVPVVAATTGHYGYFGEDRGLRALKNGLQYVLFGTGPVASNGVEACAYLDPEGGERPTIKMYCVPTVYLDADVKDVHSQDGVTLNACLLRPKSRGTVRLKSAHIFDKPIIDNNYLADPDDLRIEISGLRYAREILASNPLSKLISHEMLPGKDVVDDAGLAAHCRRTVKTNWHPVGTCRMGPDGDAMAVLDAKLRVRGVDGLRVIDASAMPFVPSGNTNAPTMAVASRAISFL
jgi:choline dehydrogenase